MRTGAKSPDAFRTISEVAEELDLPQHVLRFWETKFSQIKPLKRAGGRRYYRPDDVSLLLGIKTLLYTDGFTIKGVKKVLKEQGLRYVIETGRMVGQDDRSLPVSHQSDEKSSEPLIAEQPIVTRGAGEGEPRISKPQRAALESILDELTELKSTLDNARQDLAKAAKSAAAAGGDDAPLLRRA